LTDHTPMPMTGEPYDEPPEDHPLPETTALSPLTALPGELRQVITAVGLDLDRLDELAPELTIEDAGRILAGLSILERASSWARGDFIVYLDERYGEQASQFLNPSDYEDSSLAVYAWLARLYPLEDRIAALTPSHHRIVAKAPDRAQWLQRAVEGAWTVQQLRDAYLPERHEKASTRSDKAEAFSRSRIGQVWTVADHTALCDRLSQ
jgi:hypothetical protein